MTASRALAHRLLILGGVRSGKSAYAERRVVASGLAPVYIATAEPLDAEMISRIEAHRARRGIGWQVIEEPLDLPTVLGSTARPDRMLLVDCLTLWLSNLLGAGLPIEPAAARLEAAFGRAAGSIVLVSNEVGQGVVPANAMARTFVDQAGRLHQRLAAVADEVVLVTAGLPLTLKAPCTS
jgi:adenosylcobinamide kinase/adenosylcobinamide-phosphate guanylyltransferase